MELVREQHVIGAVVRPEDVPVPDAGMPDVGDSDWARKLVDLKGVARPPDFSGNDSDYYEWKFRFSSVMGLLGILPAMQYCADLPYQIKSEALSAEGRAKSSLLFNLLVQLV